VIKFNATTFRVGSYGFNNYLTAGGDDAQLTRITAIHCLPEVPVFFDCAWVERPADRADRIVPGRSAARP